MGDQFVVVTTKQGQLRGQQKQSLFSQDTYYAFLGIPYAKPPLGELRFKAPEPFGQWEGVRDALEDGPDPKQPTIIPVEGSPPILGDEDCLYLNIFVKEHPDKVKTKKPVLLSIHGGAFIGFSGNSKYGGPDFLLEEDIVFVTFNYRCGAFGFLSLEDASAPGNAGLKDQTFALRWVRDNIHSFGGDPANVTIMGCSAGGASVHYQLLSPTARGLFNKAIIMSGYAMNPWALQKHPKKIASALAKALGCSSEDPNEILKFLQSVSADDIVTTTNKLTNDQSFNMDTGLIFLPSVEVAGDKPFLTDSPHHLMRRGEFTKVPVIMGDAVNEGSVMGFFGVNERAFEIYNKDPTLFVPSTLGLKPGSEEEREAGRLILEFYFKGNPLSWDNVNDIYKFNSDSLFHYGMEETRTALLTHSSAPVFSYLFNNHSRCNCKIMNAMMAGPDTENSSKLYSTDACHASDALGYLYYMTHPAFPTVEITAADEVAIRKHVKAWADFVYNGQVFGLGYPCFHSTCVMRVLGTHIKYPSLDPNSKQLSETWVRDSESEPRFMDIGINWTMKDGKPLAERMDFWKGLTSKYCTA